MLELLIAEVPRLILPHEWYIYLKSKYNILLVLGGIALGVPLFLWAAFTPFVLFFGWRDMPLDEYLTFLPVAIAPPVVLVAVRLLLKKFWKPTPEVLCHNDELVKKELEKQAEEKAKTVVRDPLHWVCPVCGKKNRIKQANCARCGIAQKEVC